MHNPNPNVGLNNPDVESLINYNSSTWLQFQQDPIYNTLSKECCIPISIIAAAITSSPVILGGGITIV